MNRHQTINKIIGTLLLLTAGSTLAAPERWENVIQRFEKVDEQALPEPGQILFIGSSSIVGWDLDKFFPDHETINRGFGGSEIADSNFFFERVVTPYKPRQIVLYAGDNDVAAGKDAQRVVDDFKIFYKKVQDQVPGCPVVYVGIKPSIARWKLWPIMKDANDNIAAMAEKDENLTFFDTAAITLGKDGKPIKKLLRKDGLHLTDEGYAIWSDALRPLLIPNPKP